MPPESDLKNVLPGLLVILAAYHGEKIAFFKDKTIAPDITIPISPLSKTTTIKNDNKVFIKPNTKVTSAGIFTLLVAN